MGEQYTRKLKQLSFLVRITAVNAILTAQVLWAQFGVLTALFIMSKTIVPTCNNYG
jgi:hypothetical protein